MDISVLPLFSVGNVEPLVLDLPSVRWDESVLLGVSMNNMTGRIGQVLQTKPQE